MREIRRDSQPCGRIRARFSTLSRRSSAAAACGSRIFSCDRSIAARDWAGDLLTTLARLAHERGCGRFEWAVLDWNAPAIGFYQKLGATILPDWRIARVTGEDSTAPGGPRRSADARRPRGSALRRASATSPPAAATPGNRRWSRRSRPPASTSARRDWRTARSGNTACRARGRASSSAAPCRPASSAPAPRIRISCWPGSILIGFRAERAVRRRCCRSARAAGPGWHVGNGLPETSLQVGPQVAQPASQQPQNGGDDCPHDGFLVRRNVDA